VFYASYQDGDTIMNSTPLLLLTVLLVAGSVQAQAPQVRMTPEEHARAEACKTEMQHMCAGKTGQAAKEYLQSNESKISPKCKAQVSK
jgi:hypothetical protein